MTLRCGMKKLSPALNQTIETRTPVVWGNTRFTAITASLIRMEYSANGIFDNHPSLSTGQPPSILTTATISVRGQTFTLRTSVLTLTYRATSSGFTSRTLSIRFKHAGSWKVWTYGQKDPHNLGGTTRTLDGAIGDEFWLWKQNEQGHWSPDRKVKIDLGHGFISRSGWAIIDDSRTVSLQKRTDTFTPWAVAPPAGEHKDLYFFGHGLRYKDALADAAHVFGRQPLPPRYALGYWYSRYWAYTDREIEQMVDQFDRMKLPIDVMVIDMDWHLQGWTGYTWDPDYFPDPTALLRSLHERGIKITLNLHPADGVGKHEAAFKAMCADLDLDPATTERIPFDCTDAKFMAAYFKHLHHPEEKRGVDFWWLDWQQGNKTNIEGLDPLPWLNHLHWMDQQKKSPHRRPLNFSRYGGPGSGRYPIGFSGDTHSTWESLAYQPYFTSTASNVLYGTWSHDIGGHQPGPIGGELYTRWIQFGAYSPILRTHTSKNREAERRIWLYPEPYRDVMMEALRQRYRMIPYIYTEMRRTVDSAVSLMRPMYYEHPGADEAYAFRDQYYFGDAMLVAPITGPISEKTEMAEKKIWLPPGRWFDTTLGSLERGNSIITRHYQLDEVPVFVKAGAILPGQTDVTRLPSGSYEHLTVSAYPGGDGAYSLYEDDGISTDYLDGRSASIPLRHQTKGLHRFISIGPAKGTFRGFKKKRKVTVRLHGCPPPDSVIAGKKSFAWSFDGDQGIVDIPLGVIDLSQTTRVDVTLPAQTAGLFDKGWMGLMRRLKKVGAYANLVSPPHPVHPEERLAIRVAQTGNRLSRRPENTAAEMRACKKDLRRLPKALEEFQAEYRLRNDHGAEDILQKARDLLAQTEVKADRTRK